MSVFRWNACIMHGTTAMEYSITAWVVLCRGLNLFSSVIADRNTCESFQLVVVGLGFNRGAV